MVARQEKYPRLCVLLNLTLFPQRLQFQYM